jgi:hypothetical protein
MIKFIKNIVVFLLLMLIVGEIIIRTTHAVSDIPQRTIDEFGIQKYYPNQEGYWKGGNHKWTINKLGWPRELPSSFDNLIIIIGDSYIENFMNPNECHQSVFLKESMKNNNFLEAGRSGVSFIEAMEISKQFDLFKPVNNLIYVNDNDFYESVVEIKPIRDITQLSLNSNSIIFGEMKSPAIKKILYNWKLLYYFYNRFPLNISKKTEIDPIDVNDNVEVNEFQFENKVFELINYISINYSIKNKTLVFHPNSNKIIIEKCKKVGFNVIILDSSEDQDWTFGYDSHWTCYGHERAAQQVHKWILINKMHNK